MLAPLSLERHAQRFREGILQGDSGCRVCSRPSSWAPSPIPHTVSCNLHELRNAPKSCLLCRVLLEGVSHFAYVFNPSHDERDVSIRFDSVETFHLSRRKRAPVAHITVGLGKQLGMAPIGLRLFLQGTFRSSYYIDVNNLITASLHPPAELSWHDRNKGLADITSKVKEWMALCSSDHKCRQTNGLLPSRVLSIGSPVIQLRDTTDRRGSYAALSHCWGKHPSLTTKSANLDLHKHEIEWESLGKTYQDAIVLTKSLGLEYLWIDSLCIIQDSITDWEVESARMAYVYQNATITIAASKAEDGSAGLFTDYSQTPYIWRRGGYNIDVSANYQRSDSDLHQSSYLSVQHHDQWKPFPIRVPQGSFWIGLEPTHEVLEHRRRRPPTDIVGLGMPLFTRAWFLQERLMSPRIIHFGAMELYWECDHGMVCECLEDDINAHYSEATARSLYSSLIRHPAARNETIAHPLSNNTQQSVSMNANELNAWHKMVEEYSRLLLTREMDRLPALSGVANMLGNSYLAGIWTDYLPRCLYWTSHTTCNVFNRRPFNYRAPSFSWASIEGPVNYHDWFSKTPLHSSTQIGHVVASVVDKSSTVEGFDPSGRVKNGYITLLGHSGLATVTKVYIDGTITRCDIRRGEMKQSFQLDISICLGRTEPTEVQEGDSVMIFLLECVKRMEGYYINKYGAYQVSALVLKLESQDSSNYRRVGLIGPVSEIELENSGDRTVPVLGSLYTDAPRWFDEKREVRVV